MKSGLKKGISLREIHVVRPTNKSKDELTRDTSSLYITPFVSIIENTCHGCVFDYLEKGEDSICLGINISLNVESFFLKKSISITPELGESVFEFEAELIEITDNIIAFRVQINSDQKIFASGLHTRIITRRK